MKKIIALLAIVVTFLSCNKDLVEKPNNLIGKKEMGDILYDMSILEAIKYQSPDTIKAYGINPKTYIYKKYKIDSLQFAKSIAYYAADYREYKKMYDALNDRMKKEKMEVELIVRKKGKKAEALNKARVKRAQDSIKKINIAKELKIKKEKDSIAKKKKEDSIAKKKTDLKSKK